MNRSEQLKKNRQVAIAGFLHHGYWDEQFGSEPTPEELAAFEKMQSKAIELPVADNYFKMFKQSFVAGVGTFLNRVWG